MAYQAVGIGSSANDGNGDTLRVGIDKVNDNFVEIYTALGAGSTTALKVHTDGASAGQALVYDTGNARFQPGSVAISATISTLTFEGSSADSFETTLTVTDPTADRTITLPNVTGTVITTGNLSDITTSGTFTSNIVFEGATADSFETTLAITDPTADRTITLPNLTGTVSLITATETLTNKTLTSPSVGTALNLIEDAVMTFEGATNNSFETTLTVVDPTADRTVSLPNATDTLVGKDTTDTLTNKTLTDPLIERTLALSHHTIDAGGDIILDGAGGDIFLKDNGTTFGSLTNTSGNLIIKSGTTTAATFSSSNVTLAGTVDCGTITSTSTVKSTGLIFEGSSADSFETTVEVVDPTADRTITLPNDTGTVVLVGGTPSGTAAASDEASSSGNVTSNNARITHTLTLDGTTADNAEIADVTVTSNKVTANSVILATSTAAVDIMVHTVASGSFKYIITNKSGGTLANDSTVVTNFLVL